MTPGNHKKEIKIFPSIAAGNLLRLEEEVRKIEASGATGIHFDAMDGHFVPLLTIGVPVLEALRKITALTLDVHIMVSNPDAVAEQYLDAGADILTIHPEVSLHAHRLCTLIRGRGKKAGLALNPGTSWQTIQPMLPFIDQITVMAVNPGYSRQQHIPEVASKILELSEYFAKNSLNVEIQVDGGVNHQNIARLVQSGASNFVAGGAVMGKESYADEVAKLKRSALG